MARSCGIRLGPRRYEIVVLEGSAKRHRITAFKSAEFDPYAADPVEEAIGALRAAAKELRVPRENVGLVIDSGHAAFRHLSLPISDRSKIEQVVKFEIEAKLPQWNIDDVIVDYILSEETRGSSELLVTAVPKDDLQAALEVLENAHVEPLEAELETTAMVNAAHAAEICGPEGAQLLVYVGDHSTSVVVVDGGKVREMRVIHIGALTHEAPPPPPDAKDESDEEGEEGEEAPPPSVDPIEAGRRVEQAIKRIRRELGRTLSAARTLHPIEAIYICGMELPGLVGSSVLDVPVYILDCFEQDGGQPADGFGELVVAYGAALRQLGGGCLRPSLRREELRYAGTWERIEFPLAVASLVLVTLLGVVFILQLRKLEYQEDYGFGYWLRSSNVFMVGSRGSFGRLSPVPEQIERLVEAYPDEGAPKTDEEAWELMNRTKQVLTNQVRELEKELGQDASIQQPQSALVGAWLVLDIFDKHREDWRPSIRSVLARTEEERANRPEQIAITMDVVFFADDDKLATRHYEEFLDELASVGRGWLIEAPQQGSTPLDGGGGLHVPNLQIDVNARWFYDELRRQEEARVQ